MLRVGLTGGLASGKSFAAAEFARLGRAVLEADKLGHQILADEVNARAEVVAEFGTGVLGPEARLTARRSLPVSPKPYRWKASGAEILAKIQRARQALEQSES